MLSLQILDLRRKIDLITSSIESRSAQRFQVLIDTRNDTVFDFSVSIPFYTEKEKILRCLDSVVNLNTTRNFEVILCNDAGDRETINLALEFLSKKSIQYAVAVRDTNGGVGATRNDLIKMARSNALLMLDGDNELFPNGADLLYDAVSGGACNSAFSYGILAIEEAGEKTDIMNFQQWDRKLFAEIGNYIDAFAMIDREKILKSGGYTEALELYGWEDFELWARLAENQFFGIGVRNFVGIYHRSKTSMISLTNIDISDALAIIKSGSPSLFKT
jgi:glycosyltransferase involved in cell wall biosynthesis